MFGSRNFSPRVEIKPGTSITRDQRTDHWATLGKAEMSRFQASLTSIDKMRLEKRDLLVVATYPFQYT